MEKYIDQMIALNDKLLEASEKYYQEDVEIMTNAEYDALYDELVALEEKYSYILPNSITQKVGSEVVSNLVKEKHEQKALSLDKTKDPKSLVSWLKDKVGMLSWKLDGLTIVATYNEGKLQKAVTRGNGEIGEVITHNAKFFKGLPKVIDYKGKMIVRGEALMTYSEFERINRLITEAESKYKNPRNLASGTIRQLDSSVCRERTINFKAFQLVSIDESVLNGEDTFESRFNFLTDQHFDVVEHELVTSENLEETIKRWEKQIEANDFPSDGLVVFYNDVKYGESLGTTAKYPKNGMAFKWRDEVKETTIKSIEWQTSRTGRINPVAIFEPVELEGTTVNRATANNVSIVKKLKLAVGSKITVYKANMIIPTILENVEPAGIVKIPAICPSCGQSTTITTSDEGVETLNCTNPLCAAKNIARFTHFVSRDALNIVGLSEQTFDKFLGLGFIKEFADIYKLDKYSDVIISLEGFGPKSFKKLQEAIKNSENVNFVNFLYAIGIPNIGIVTAKDICKTLKLENMEAFLDLIERKFDFTVVPNIGEIVNDSIYEWASNRDNINEISELLQYITFNEVSYDVANTLEGKTFVITGSLEHFTNRKELQKKIEDLGGKVTGSVSASTTYLVNNDIESNSSKNKKAKELNIPIISEEELLEMLN